MNGYVLLPQLDAPEAFAKSSHPRTCITVRSLDPGPPSTLGFPSMALEIPLTDLARGRVQLKLSISGGNATLDIKPGSPSLVTPLHPNDLVLHLSSTKQDDHIVVSMWTTLPTPCSSTQGTADTASWDWQEEYSRTDGEQLPNRLPSTRPRLFRLVRRTAAAQHVQA